MPSPNAVSIGGPISETTVTLRFHGDDLDPAVVSAALGTPPTSSAKKGGALLTRRGAEITARTGTWLLWIDRRRPGDLNDQIVELLSPLTIDTAVWQDLVSRFSSNIFCGLFMDEDNEGLSLRPETLLMIGARGLVLNLDVYCLDGREAEVRD
jgi:Domain of unknown function (DUF4279)